MDSKEDNLELSIYERKSVTSWGNKKKCKNCGKDFFVFNPEQWVYKRKKTYGRLTYYCSWSCFRKEK